MAIGRPPRPWKERFWEKIDKTEDGCWLWTGSLNRPTAKYPNIYPYGFLKISGKNKRAHRLSWEIHNGKIEDGLIVCHKCDNPSCVNPGHLFLGSFHDNMIDMINKKRSAGQRGTRYQPNVTGSANGRAKLTEEIVKQIRSMLVMMSPKNVAAQLDVSLRAVHHIKKGTTWKHVQ